MRDLMTAGVMCSWNFDYGSDMDLKSIQVRDRVDQVRGRLPEDLERIEMRRWDSADWEILDYNMIWLGDDQSELATVYKNTIFAALCSASPGWAMSKWKVPMKEYSESMSIKIACTPMAWTFAPSTEQFGFNNINISSGYVTEGDKRLAVRASGRI